MTFTCVEGRDDSLVQVKYSLILAVLEKARILRIFRTVCFSHWKARVGFTAKSLLPPALVQVEMQ